MKRIFSIFLVLMVSFLSASTLAAQESEAAAQDAEVADSFSETLDVTIVELMIDPHDKKGNPVLGLTAEDFKVWEDGEPVEVIGLDYPSASPAAPRSERSPSPATATAATAAVPLARPATAEWRFLIYFDAPLTGQRSIRRAIDGLENRVEELVARGPVEIVMANPAPRLVQPFTRDPGLVRQALKEVAKEPARNDLLDERRAHMRLLDTRLTEGNGPDAEASARALIGPIRSAVQREYNLIDRRVRTFSEWMAAYGDVPASAAIVVSDGFDLEPSNFYLDSTSTLGVQAALSAELQEYQLSNVIDGLGRQLAATGWTTMMMSVGGSSVPPVSSDASLAQRDRFRSIGAIGTAGPDSASTNTVVGFPMEPLSMVAEQTGGQVITTRKKAGPAIDRLAQRPRLIYRAPRARDGRVHEVRVETTRPGVQLHSARWVRSPTLEQVMASRARRLLVLDSDAGEMPVRLEFPTVGPKTNKGARTISAEVSFDLTMLKEVLQNQQVPLSLTFGVEIPNRPPFVHRVEQAFNLPSADTRSWPELLYQTIIEVPADTERLSVVVEEPSTGVWGGAVSAL